MKTSTIVKLYKYQSLSEGKHFQFLQNYLEQKIWLTPLQNFNDPFEGRFQFIPFSPEFILKSPTIFDSILREHHSNGEPDLSVRELKDRLISPDFLEQNKKHSSKVINDFFSGHGATCLTTEFKNIPMWAYYADNHKGICLEFEFNFSYIQNILGLSAEQLDEFKDGIMSGRDILSFNVEEHEFAFVKINYSDEIPVINLEHLLNLRNTYDQTKYMVCSSVGVKYKQWRHENEFRLIANSNGEKSGPLALETYAKFLKLTGIIMGSNLTENYAKLLHQLCNNLPIKLYKSTCSAVNYEILVPEIN